MSARSCQLCGKPLSRIWVGSGGDFCSREHRNQYRLRQGMGRLQEANRVASVMRRREHLRPLPHSKMANASAVSRRGFFRLPFLPQAKPIIAATKIAPRLAPLRVTAVANRCVPQKLKAGISVCAPKAAANAHFTVQRRPILAPQRALKLPTRMPQAPPSKQYSGSSAPKTKRLAFGMALPVAKRIAWNRRTLAAPAIRLPGAGGNRSAAKAAPTRGNALRVSYACGFRARPQHRVFAPIAVSAPKLRWQENTATPPVLRRGVTPEPAMRTIAIPVGRIAYPPGPMPAEPAPRVRRLPVPVRMPSPFAGNGTANTAERNWNLQNDSMTLPDPELRQWEPARFNAVPVIAFKPPAATGRGTAQYLLAPFVPQDTPCGVTFNVGQNGSKDQKR